VESSAPVPLPRTTFPRLHQIQPKNLIISKGEKIFTRNILLYMQFYFALSCHLIELHISAAIRPIRILKRSGSNTSSWPSMLKFLYFSYHFRMNSRLLPLNGSVYLPVHCSRFFIQNHPFISFESSHVNPAFRKLTQNVGKPTLPSVISCWCMVTHSIYRLYTKCSDVKCNTFRFNLFL
jgi:hypothetical protein